MTFKNIRDAVRFSAEKMTKVNLFETDRMFCDVYGLDPGQEQKVHTHEGADKIAGVEHGVRNTAETRLMLLVFMAPNPNVRG